MFYPIPSLHPRPDSLKPVHRQSIKGFIMLNRAVIFVSILLPSLAHAGSLNRYWNPVRPVEPEAPIQRWIQAVHRLIDQPLIETRDFRIGILPFGAIEIRFK